MYMVPFFNSNLCGSVEIEPGAITQRHRRICTFEVIHSMLCVPTPGDAVSKSSTLCCTAIP